MKHPIIGLVGPAGSGKSAVAKILTEDFGCTRTPLAGPLKSMLRTLDPFLGMDEIDGELTPIRYSLARELFTEAEIKERYPEYRTLLQRLGTDCLRRCDDRFWINQIASHVTKLRSLGPVVVEDVRFFNEAAWIVDLNGGSWDAVWRVDRGIEASSHSSETEQELIEAGHVVVNEGDLEDLRERVAEVLNETMWRNA